MGCVFSKHFGDNNLKIFHVWNVDEQGNHLNQGKIEITHSDLILHQKSKAPIKWPLRSLRRYGFDAELFSFESGRRCPTGPGIYAFKCRQAECLFNVLQECIQNSGGAGSGTILTGAGIVGSPTIDESLGSVSGLVTTNSLLANIATVSTIGAQGPILSSSGGVPLTVDTVGYLEPISSATAAAIANTSQPRSSISSASTLPAVIIEPSLTGTVSPARGSLPGLGLYSSQAPIANGSGISVCTCAACTALGRTSIPPHYINEDVFNGVPTRPNTVVFLPHQYVNSTAIIGDKTCTQRSLVGSHLTSNNVIGETSSTTSVMDNNSSSVLYMNGGGVGGQVQLPVSRSTSSQCHCPPLGSISYVDQNTNYARLDDLLKQEQQHSAKRQKDSNRFYVNVTPDSVSSSSTSCPSSGGLTLVGLAKNSRNTPTMSRSNTVTSPTGFMVGLIPKSPTVHFYANLGSPGLPLMGSEVLSSNFNGVEEDNEFDPSEDEPQVNYITLDLNHQQPPLEICEPPTTTTSSSPPSHGNGLGLNLPSPPSSPFNNAEGYATIDFDKTAALSNSVNPGSIMDDSIRKTRHNSSIPALP